MYTVQLPLSELLSGLLRTRRRLPWRRLPGGHVQRGPRTEKGPQRRLPQLQADHRTTSDRGSRHSRRPHHGQFGQDVEHGHLQVRDRMLMVRFESYTSYKEHVEAGNPPIMAWNAWDDEFHTLPLQPLHGKATHTQPPAQWPQQVLYPPLQTAETNTLLKPKLLDLRTPAQGPEDPCSGPETNTLLKPKLLDLRHCHLENLCHSSTSLCFRASGELQELLFLVKCPEQGFFR